jgi:heme-degrading monooxygenase HmoA
MAKEEAMHARVMTYQIHPEKIEETERIVRESVVSDLRQQKGFKGALILTDANRARSMSITLWETEEDLTASATSGFVREQLAKVRDYLASAPTREAYEVRIQV